MIHRTHEEIKQFIDDQRESREFEEAMRAYDDEMALAFEEDFDFDYADYGLDEEE
jgi:hypothetical protein